MLPRVSLRRSFLYLLVITCFLFLAVNVHQRELWARTLVTVEMTPGGATPPHAAPRESSRDMDEDNPREQEDVNEEQVYSFALF